MTLALARRLEVRGTLVCRSALSIGAWDESPLADIAVARDGTGRFVVPGTSLAGALRSWYGLHGTYGQYGRHPSEDDVRALFGYVKEGSQQALASLIRIDDAPVDDVSATVTVQVRDGVRIDPRTGSAMAGFLFSREVLPAGTRSTFRLTADVQPPEAPRGGVEVEAAVRDLVSALVHGAVDLGGRTSQGLGRVVLEDATISDSDLGSRDGLLAWLRNGPVPVPFVPAPRGATGRLGIEISWRPRRAVLVRDAEPGTAVNALPLTARDADDRVRLLIPGSSIKGALRAHAERIVRTLRERDAPGDTRTRETLPAVAALFGTGPGTEGQPLAAGYRGILRIEDCHSAGFVTSSEWESVRSPRPDRGTPSATGAPASAGDSADPFERRRQDDETRRSDRAALASTLAGLGLALRVSDHVAVDRWTGGPASGRLFSVLEPMGTAWEPIKLSVDTWARPEPPAGPPRPEAGRRPPEARRGPAPRGPPDRPSPARPAGPGRRRDPPRLRDHARARAPHRPEDLLLRRRRRRPLGGPRRPHPRRRPRRPAAVGGGGPHDLATTSRPATRSRG